MTIGVTGRLKSNDNMKTQRFHIIFYNAQQERKRYGSVKTSIISMCAILTDRVCSGRAYKVTTQNNII